MTDISPTQLKAKKLCDRLFGGQYLCGFPSGEKTPAQALGHDTHKNAEAYHKTGVKPPEDTLDGQLFKLALPHVPPPQTGRVEGEFRLNVSGISYQGLLDLEYEEGLGLTVILDYKTTSVGPKKWLQTRDEFLADEQALIYAIKVLVAKKADRVKVKWVYIKHNGFDKEGNPKKGKKFAEPRECTLFKDEIVEAFRKVVHPAAKEIVQLRKKYPERPATNAEGVARFLSFEPNFNSCYAFGPCKFMDLCNDNKPDEITEGVEEDMGDLLDELENEMAEEKEAPKPAPEKKAAKGINSPEKAQVNAAPPVEKTAAAVAPTLPSNGREVPVARLLRAIADLLEV